MYRNFIKRILDVLIAVAGIIMLSPIFLISIICLFIVNRGNPFFIQIRPGKHEQLFCLIKFKTMNDAKDSSGKLLSDDMRITKIGSIIRKTSIDELPQLFNVLKGDMSLIGPRPLLVNYLPLYNSFQKKRHLVRPGITGWAQINGRNNLDWEKKFELDVWYVENLSFSTDIKIFFATIIKVLRREGISQLGYSTAEPFIGNN